MLNQQDQQTLASRGISETQLLEQIKRFETGFPYLRIADSARVGAGIVALESYQEDEAIARWDKYLADGGSVSKFVPASGAASRMFKALFAFVDGNETVPLPVAMLTNL